jgi:arylsulfatase
MDFFLGKQKKSNRDGFPVFNGDELYAYKYRNYKMHFIRLDSMFEAPEKLNMPQMFNLIQDPKELYPLDKVNVAEAWFMAPVSKRILEFKRSLAKEPPIQLGTPDPYVPKK